MLAGHRPTLVDSHVEQNEMEKILRSGGNIGVMKSEAIRYYKELQAEKEELEKQLDQKPAFEMDLSNAILLNDMTDGEIQQLKDYAQKLREERVETEQYYKVMGDYECVRYLTKNKEWGDSSSCIDGVDFKSFKRGYKGRFQCRIAYI